MLLCSHLKIQFIACLPHWKNQIKKKLCFLKYEWMLATGVGNAAVLSEIAGVSAIAAVEAVVEGWYSARANYQFPGGNESFDACHENKSISEYSSFTQVRPLFCNNCLNKKLSIFFLINPVVYFDFTLFTQNFIKTLLLLKTFLFNFYTKFFFLKFLKAERF